jgi:hypothetical protein
MVKFDMNALFAAVQQGLSQESEGFSVTLDSQLTQVSPPSQAPPQDDPPTQSTPSPSVLSSNRLGLAPACFPTGTLIHSATITPSESFIASPGNVIVPRFPTRMNKPDPAPTKKKATTKKKPSKAATKAAKAATKRASSSSASSSTSKKIPPRTHSQPSITQTLAEMQETVTEIKESELDLNSRKMQQFMQQEARADMDNYFGDDSMDFLKDDEDFSVASAAKSDYSGGILEVYNSPDAKPRKSAPGRKILSSHGEKKIDKQQITRKKNRNNTSNLYICTHCQSTDCHNQVYGDFLEKSLENYALTNNKETLTHMEVYKYYMSRYNTAIQISTHKVTHEVGYGDLPLPGCLYASSFLLMVKRWGVDVKSLREQRREHLSWIRKREMEMKRQSKRRKKYSVL